MRTILKVLAIPVFVGVVLAGIALVRNPLASGWFARGHPRPVAALDIRPEFPGAPTRPVEALRLLRARDFATLTRVIEERQRQQELDIRSERRMGAVLVAFSTADPTVTPLVDEWVAAMPGSFPPKLARAVHRLALASRARGTKWASETTAAQCAGMGVHLILSDAIELTGGNAEAYYWRGRAYLTMNDLDRGLEDFESAIRCDVRHFESYRNVDYVFARRRQWDDVISHWTQYLDAAPGDGRGYLERGGARYHKGDREAAAQDIRKGCELGTQEACDVLPRVIAGR